jgi:carbon storage regulator
MLVLTRKAGESIVVNEQITIVIVEMRGRYAHVGIEAPRGMPIRRGELPARTTDGSEPGDAHSR